MFKKNKKIFVAMSGGVDSSVSAALLQKKGFDVTGVFIKAWHLPFADCSWQNDRRDAMRVASVLGIPFKTLNLEKEYKRSVIDYMLAEYGRGRTPNPDVVCNKEIKFGEFYRYARKKGVDYIATGHYARVMKRGDYYTLRAGVDKNKDQSYFLWAIDKKTLPHILFPVGGMLKSDVRKMAEQFKLPVSEKKDSQGLCFVGKFDFKEFLKKYLPVRTGKVLDINGRVIGKHDGVQLYTLGERHGFSIEKKTPDNAPYYVINRNMKKNTITVSHTKKEGTAFTQNIHIDKPNWLLDIPVARKKYTARTRYRQPLEKCSLKKTKKEWEVIFDTKQASVTPGQSLVVYDKDICLGGGIIE